ncbi:MAG: crotonobetainyl-CoA:carnitine CoA-transferase CaiB-like acyl-CoA transferase [Halioglobus sp.]|jgi:crotonobetainyl-CoA:carnitine CoA-transferase CaiB-like acyl-CoA transferase
MLTRSYQGLRVLDLSTNIAGPMTAMLLGDMGADVIKVERSPGGDDTRALDPKVDGESTVYLSMNRNKRSLLLDFKSDDDLAQLYKLIAAADVIIESFPPGVAEKLGLSPQEIRELNGSAVLCSVSAFGDGPLGSVMPGYDALVQAVSGMMSFTGAPDGEDVRIAPSILDVSTGMWSCMSIMAALHGDSGKGEFQHISRCLIDSAMLMMGHQVQGYLATGVAPEKLGSGAPSAVPYRVYRSRDGKFMLATASEPQFARLCAALGLDHLVSDQRFSSMAARIANRDELDTQLQQCFLEHDTSHWLVYLANAGLSVGSVNDLNDALQLDVVKERNLFLDPDSVGWCGGQPLLRSPLDSEAKALRRPPPRLGEHSQLIMDELRNSADWPADLVDEGASGS